MKTLHERFRSRFEWGLVADVQIPDYETRMNILRTKSAKSKVPISEEILFHMADVYMTDIRVLDEALDKIMTFAGACEGTLTIEMVDDVLK